MVCVFGQVRGGADGGRCRASELAGFWVFSLLWMASIRQGLGVVSGSLVLVVELVVVVVVVATLIIYQE